MQKDARPPRMFHRFFCWFCHPPLRDSIEGDLLELYQERLHTKGRRKAGWLFIIDVMLLLRPGIIRSVSCPTLKYQNQYSMLKNNFKIGWRNIARDKAHSLLNIFSLCAGLTCFTFIALWVCDELSYDKFNTHYDRIVRLTATVKTETGTKATALSSAPMAKALMQDYSEVEDAVRLKMREEIITHDGHQVLQPGILVTDPSFFNIFSYRLDRGNRATALDKPYTLILTRSAAKKYFGDSDPMGQTLLLNMYDSSGTGALYTITGVMPDPVQNAHFTFTMLSSFKTIEVTHPELLTADGWGDASFHTYLLLKKNVDIAALSAKIRLFYGKYIGALFNTWQPIYSYQVQRLSDIHLRSDLHDEIAPTGSISRVYIFSLIGIFILLLAGINYTNLATARAAGRAKEVSIKKVIGAAKGQLVSQFLLESTTLSFLALLFSLGLAIVLKPAFLQLTGKNISVFSSPLLLLFLAATAVVVGMAAGFYPAMILSSFRPAIVLKGAFKSGRKGVLLRRTLVVSQFVITVVLVTGIVVINSQMAFMRTKDLGYDKDALLFIAVNGNTDVINGYTAFKDELQASPLVSGVATSNSLIVGGLSSGGALTVDAKGAPLQVNTARLRVDSAYFHVYGIQLLAGKNFTADTGRQVLLNEMAVKKFGWPNAAAAIGKPFQIGDTRATVTGVVKDFHYNTLQRPIEPLAIYPSHGRFSRITLRGDMRNPKALVKMAEAVWKKHFKGALFDYDFVSQQIKNQYIADERFSRIFLFFSVLSLVIACLGLYGLVSYTVFQRTREIGVRKILGANAISITTMLSAEPLQMLLLSCLIATPVAWLAMNRWLQDFAYRTNLSWWMFAVGGALVLLIALATISTKAIKSAMANPVSSLRTG